MPIPFGSILKQTIVISAENSYAITATIANKKLFLYNSDSAHTAVLAIKNSSLGEPKNHLPNEEQQPSKSN